MKLMALALIALICSCNKPVAIKHTSNTPQSHMNFPSNHPLDCPPFGTCSILFDVLEDDDGGDDGTALPREVAEDAGIAVMTNWNGIWSEVFPRVEELLKDYEYGMTVAELLADPKNTIYVTIIPPQEWGVLRLRIRRNEGRGGS
jgi:hypothetical protein